MNELDKLDSQQRQNKTLGKRNKFHERLEANLNRAQRAKRRERERERESRGKRIKFTADAQTVLKVLLLLELAVHESSHSLRSI